MFSIRTSIEEWKTTVWSNIDVENMDMECKKFAKVICTLTFQFFNFFAQDVRGFDKTMRPWHAYNGLDTTVKNMITSLRAVGELQNSAIRDRHWDQVEFPQFSRVLLILDHAAGPSNEGEVHDERRHNSLRFAQS